MAATAALNFDKKYLEKPEQSWLGNENARGRQNLEKPSARNFSRSTEQHFSRSFRKNFKRDPGRNFERVDSKNFQRDYSSNFRKPFEKHLFTPDKVLGNWRSKNAGNKSYIEIVATQHLEFVEDFSLEIVQEKNLEKHVHEHVEEVADKPSAMQQMGKKDIVREDDEFFYDYKIRQQDNFALEIFDFDLPCGWERLVTDEGLKYYVDHHEKKTQWFHPLQPGSVIEMKAGPMMTVQGELLRPVGGGRKWKAKFQLGEFDCMVKDMQLCFCNEPNGKRQERSPAYEKVSLVLPPGWIKSYDTTTGRIYFKNTATGKTQFTEPLRIKSIEWHEMAGTAGTRKLHRHRKIQAGAQQRHQERTNMQDERKRRKQEAMRRRDDKQKELEQEKLNRKNQVKMRAKREEQDRLRREKEKQEMRNRAEREKNEKRRRLEQDKANRGKEQQRKAQQRQKDAQTAIAEKKNREQGVQRRKQEQLRENQRRAEEEVRRKVENIRKRQEQSERQSREKAAREAEVRKRRERDQREGEERRNKVLQKQKRGEAEQKKKAEQQEWRLKALQALIFKGDLGFTVNEFDSKVAETMPGFAMPKTGYPTVNAMISRSPEFKEFEIHEERVMQQAAWRKIQGRNFDRKKVLNGLEIFANSSELIRALEQQEAAEQQARQAQAVSRPANMPSPQQQAARPMARPMAQQTRLPCTPGLPYGFTAHRDGSRRIYFSNHHNKQTTYIDPRPLPQGFGSGKTPDGRAYYINHRTKQNQWHDPRPPLEQALRV